MTRVDYMSITFRGKDQMRRFEDLVDREMTPTIYADDRAMTALGIRESVLYLLNQIGWDTSPIRRRFSSYRRLTLEFLSSLNYVPNHGLGFNRGLIRFRLFSIDFCYNNSEFANLLGFPSGPDVFTVAQEDILSNHELNYFWGSITGNNHPEPDDMHSDSIHNPAIRYFHKILAHTLFGKEQNISLVSRDELFILFCASQNRPVNAATFMLANFVRIIETAHTPILIGGLVTMIANAIGMRQPLLGLNPYGGIRPMNIRFCFNTHLIGNLGPLQFDLLINHNIVHQFVLPNPITSVHNRDNWIFDLDPPSAPTSPETP